MKNLFVLSVLLILSLSCSAQSPNLCGFTQEQMDSVLLEKELVDAQNESYNLMMQELLDSVSFLQNQIQFLKDSLISDCKIIMSDSVKIVFRGLPYEAELVKLDSTLSLSIIDNQLRMKLSYESPRLEIVKMHGTYTLSNEFIDFRSIVKKE